MEFEAITNLYVISKDKRGPYSVHDIQCNPSWSHNPYGDSYAVIPDDLVAGIEATRGFCDLTLSDDGSIVIDFVALEIPEISAVSEPTQLDIIEAQVAYTAVMTGTLLEV